METYKSDGMQNPPNLFFLKTILIIGVVIIVAGLALSLIRGISGYAVITFVLFAFVLFFYIFLEIIHKPKLINIQTNGISLEFRFSKPLFVRYEDIVWITPSRHNDRGNGTLGIKRRFHYSMEYAACRAIREDYYHKMGKYPRER